MAPRFAPAAAVIARDVADDNPPTRICAQVASTNWVRGFVGTIPESTRESCSYVCMMTVVVLVAVLGLIVAISIPIAARRKASMGHAQVMIEQYPKIPALAGGSLALATNAIYLWLIFHQGVPVDVATVTIVASIVLVAALLAFAGALTIHIPAARACLLTATFLLLTMGVLGMFSIGLPLFVAGLLTLVNAVGPARRQRTDDRPPPNPTVASAKRRNSQ